MATTALVTVDQEDMQLVEAWLHDKATTTQRAYRRFAWAMLTALGKPVRELTAMEVKQYAMSLTGEAGKLAYNTNALKSLFTYATELGYIPVNLGKLLKSPKVRDELAKRILSEAEVIDTVQISPLLIYSGHDSRRDDSLIRSPTQAHLRATH